ncbi:MAG: DUF2007 domain-containing protein [Bacteroidota bacterium]|nr:DUF2007 domain-containing protein [Bacteroidota bacterium]
MLKIYEGSQIEALGCQNLLLENNIESVLKDNIQSGILAGFGTSGMAVELYVNEDDFEEALALLSNNSLD